MLPFPTKKMPAPQGLGAAAAGAIGAEQRYQSAVNSPTAQANRVKATGDPRTIAAQKTGGFGPDGNFYGAGVKMRKPAPVAGLAALPAPPAKVTPAQGLATVKARTAEISSSLNPPGRVQLGTGSMAGASTAASAPGARTHLGSGSLAGASTAASGAPAVTPGGLQPPQKATGQPMGSMAFTGLQPRQPAAPVAAAPVAPAVPSLPAVAPSAAPALSPGLPATPAAPVAAPAAPPGLAAAPAPAPLPPPPVAPVEDDPGPDEALNQYADEQLAGAEWKDDVNGPKRGKRASGGAYHGMTQEQALNSVQNKFRGLAPQQKQQYHERGKSLRYRPASAPATSLRN